MDNRTLRTLVAAVQTEIGRATTPDGPSDKEALTHAWNSLVEHLTLGPTPETRPCPHCTREVMRAATLCGYCWSRLVPAASQLE